MMTGVRIAQPPGPLAVSSTNPRYFSAAAAPEEAVYLTGSHVNNNRVPGAVLTIPDDSKIKISAPPEIAGPAVVHLRRISS